MRKITQYHVYLNFQDKNLEDCEISCNFITVPVVQRYLYAGVSEEEMLNTIASYRFKDSGNLTSIYDNENVLIATIQGNDFFKEVALATYKEKDTIRYSLYAKGFEVPVYCWNSNYFKICTDAEFVPEFR